MLHAFVHPVYAPKYPPAQSAFLALGDLLGDPFYGVLLSGALFAAAVCWMLQAFVRPAWSLIGGIATALYFGAGHYWTESYWGGAVGALGAALSIGAFGRMQRDGRCGWLFGLGAAILLFSRPYEGGVLIALLGIVLLVRRARSLLPALIPALIAIAMLGVYNRAITGSPFKLPYRVYTEQYAGREQFWFLPAPAKIAYTNPAIGEVFQNYDLAEYREIRELSIPGRLWRNVLMILSTIWYDGGLAALLPLLFIPFLRRDPDVRFFGSCLAVLFGSLLILVLPFMHYMAPLLVAITLTDLLVLDRLWCLRSVRSRDRVMIVALLAAAFLYGPAMRAVHATRGETSPLYRGDGFGFVRARMTDDILAHPGDHLVFVRWSPSKPVMPPWVANSAQFEKSRIIWAHDRGAENRELIDSYPNRHFWLLEDDSQGVRIAPYPETPLLESASR